MNNNKTQSGAERERRTPEQVAALKERVLNGKKRLPLGAVGIFIKWFPDFNTYKKSSRVANVLSLRIVDEDITEKLESLADEHAINK